MAKDNVQPIQKVESEGVKTPQDFADAYNRLIAEFGYEVVSVPVWIKRDDGSFSLVVQQTVGEISKKK